MKNLTLLALMCLLTVGVFAQKNIDRPQIEGDGNTTVSGPVIEGLELSGQQVSSGRRDALNQMVRNVSYVLVTGNSRRSATLTVSLDYNDEGPVPNYFEVTGGNWTLVVYEDGLYSGTIYGDITEGVVEDRFDEENGNFMERTVKSVFIIKGGMDNHEDVEIDRAGTFSAKVDGSGTRAKSMLYEILN